MNQFENFRVLNRQTGVVVEDVGKAFAVRMEGGILMMATAQLGNPELLKIGATIERIVGCRSAPGWLRETVEIVSVVATEA